MITNELVRNSELDWYTERAAGIAFDTCHKIYVLMDDEQVKLMREYGYGDANDPDSLITSDQMTPTQMAERIAEWYEASCSLKFIQAVETNHKDPNAGFYDIVEQGAGWIEDEDEDEDED
jgi:hypothetical protein